MGKALVGIAGLIVGTVLGALFGGAMKIGTAAGIGIATGLSAGICSTINAAVGEGFLTPDQVDQVLDRAVQDMASVGGDDVDRDIIGGAEQCDEVMARLREEAG